MLFKYGFSFLKHGTLWTYRLATWLVLAAGVLFAFGVLALRYVVLPHVDDYREWIAHAVGSAIGQSVQIRRIEGSWHGYRPELQLEGVRILDPAGKPALELERVRTALAMMPLLRGQLVFHSIELDEPTLQVRRDTSGTIWVAGAAVRSAESGGGLAIWMLAQRQIVVRNARIEWSDELRGTPPLAITGASLRLDNSGERHVLGLAGVPPADLASPFSLRGEFSGISTADLAAWTGHVYAEFDYADLARLQSWMPLPVPVDSGLGAMRIWADVAGTGTFSATADVNFADIRTQLGPALQPLALARFSGRLEWQRAADGFRVAGSQVRFVTPDGVSHPPLTFELQRSGRQSRFSCADLQLAPLVALAGRLPLDETIRTRLATAAPAGVLHSARVSWEGDWDPGTPYAIEADFEALTLRPLGAIPGLKGFGGHVEATQAGGKISLHADNGTLEFPAVFVAPIPVDHLSAEADWEPRGDRVSVGIRSATFTNEHVAGSVSGTYLSSPQGPGDIDLSGRLIRGEARDVWRYIPVFASGTRDWLKRALVRGQANDVRLRLAGPLERFPFSDGRSGKFEVSAKVQGVTLDYAEGWPPVEDIAGEVAFRGGRMDIQASAGHIYGVAVGNVRASIPAIGDGKEHLVVHGDGQGPIADYLRFIAHSPTREHIDGFTDDMRGTGSAKLRLDVDLPLREPELAKASGTVQLDATEFIVDPRVPPLTAASAQLEFSEHSVEVREGQAAIYGQPLSFRGGTRKDGAIAISLGGRLDVERLYRQFDTMLLAQLAGTADWKGTLTMKNKSARLRLESGLNGIESRLPAPLAKPAAATLPLKAELRHAPGAPARLFVSLQEVVSAALVLDGATVRRGEIAFSHDAEIPDRDGVQVTGSLATLDVDAWRGLLGGGDGAGRLSAVDLSVGALDITGRRFHQLRIQGEHGEEGWQLALSGRELNGTVSWVSEDGGRLGAHFDSLVIPAPSLHPDTTLTSAQDRERLPGVDLVADSFEFEGKKLGRLRLNAVPEATSWRLDRLLIESPDGSMDVKGRWTITDMPRTALEVRIQTSDIGKLLQRLGYAEGVRGGSGSLAGQVSWIGSPSRLDLPSLAGQLKLEAKNGRFAKLDPGAAKLLGILSLQALPRRLTLDFRDIFSSGFSFDSITADVKVTGGVAQTDDFKMTGSSAQVRMKGSVDLAAETQDLNVRVLPQLSTGVAIAGAVVNPAVGLAALLAQKALGDPFEKLAAQEYRVTGSWTDPKVERASKAEDQSAKGRK